MVNFIVKIHFENNITMYDWARVFQNPAVSYLLYFNDAMQRGFTNVYCVLAQEFQDLHNELFLL